jgi:hypothetical protein
MNFLSPETFLSQNPFHGIAMNHSFHLHAPRSMPATPIESAGNWPSEVAGQPATYFWKEMIHAGNYVHPTRGYALDVDQNRLVRWAATGERMLAAGVPIPINCDHSDRARDVVGYVKQFKVDGDQLLGLCQFIGPDAALTAARNWVSVGINPDFKDGEARKWGEAIVHLALTPVPVVPDQGGFLAAARDGEIGDTLILAADTEPTPPPQAASASAPSNAPAGAEDGEDAEVDVACTAAQLALLQQLLPGGADLSGEDCLARIIQHLQALADSDEDDDEDDDEEPDLSVQLAGQLSAANQRIAELSARIPAAPGPELQAALVEVARAKFDAAVNRGGLSPAARDRLVAALVQSTDGTANVLALSRAANPGGQSALALAIADILLENQAISLGSATGLQTLPRAVPGEESPAIFQLREYMTKVASVSG